jgi:uncharacterized protein
MGPSIVYTHLLAAYFVAFAPLLGYLRHRRAKEQIRTGDALAKARFLRELFAKQAISICLVCGLWLVGGVPRPLLGLGAPPSWWRTVALTTAAVIYFIISGFRLRAKSGKMRKNLDERAGALIPDSTLERRWFAAVCVGGGTFEELAYRGFLFYYLALVFPAINAVEKALVTSLLFGIVHVYQGWKGVLSTGISGLIMAALYLAGGNLLLPAVSHIVANLRVLLIFPPKAMHETRS